MEIERKFVVLQNNLPDLHPYERYSIMQGYLSRTPEIRIRRKENNSDKKFLYDP